jgi:hypothetical protein
MRKAALWAERSQLCQVDNAMSLITGSVATHICLYQTIKCEGVRVTPWRFETGAPPPTFLRCAFDDTLHTNMAQCSAWLSCRGGCL